MLVRRVNYRGLQPPWVHPSAAFLHLKFGLHNDKTLMGYKREVKNLPEKKKVGRPTDNPKGTSIHVRLDNECVDILEKYTTQEKVSRAEAYAGELSG